MIKHYDKQNAATRHDILLGRGSYYLNVLLLLVTLLARTKLLHPELKYEGLLLLINLVVLVSYFDFHNFFSNKRCKVAFFTIGMIFLAVLIMLTILQMPNISAYAMGDAIGSIFAILALTVSFLMAVFGKTYMTN